jgi:6-phosphofructokinase 1
LTRENTRTIDRRGGTMLHTSRTNPLKMHNLSTHLAGEDFPVSPSHTTKTWDISKQVLSNLSALGIEHLIAIGGDDTLSHAAKLNEFGVKIVGIPKTMDNDVRNTEYCIGFSMAITRASDAIQRQRKARTSASAFFASSAAFWLYGTPYRVRNIHPLCRPGVQGESR